MREDEYRNKMSDSELSSQPFAKALNDYFLLLNQGYPERPALKLVGDRYRLSGRLRLILYRGITSESKARCRHKKEIHRWKNRELHVDLYNVLFTLMNYLLGKTIFIANDGFLRDAGESYGQIENQSLFLRSVALLLDHCSGPGPGRIFFYLDRTVKNSQDHAMFIKKGCMNREISCRVLLLKHADSALREIDEGIVSTSDSEIIDRTPCRIFDLSRHILTREFHPHIPELGSRKYRKTTG